jgi:hypothetical protein
VGTGSGTEAGGGAGGAGGGAGAMGAAKAHARIASNILIGVDAPPNLRPFQLKVVFEVDSNGRGRIVSATRTRDENYNRKLMAQLAELRFHPATLATGKAVADTIPLEWDF